jgi:hypothetical protein
VADHGAAEAAALPAMNSDRALAKIKVLSINMSFKVEKRHEYLSSTTHGAIKILTASAGATIFKLNAALKK